MAISVLMPHMGESVVEGTVVRWLKHEGQPVKRDETIAEVETAKADVEIPAPADGVLVRIIARAGETVKVGSEIAIVDKQAAAPRPEAPPSAMPASAVSAPAVPPVSAETAGSRRLTITPVVAKLMERHGLGMDDLPKIAGTGAGGRVTKQDVLAYLARRGVTVDQAAAPAPPGAAEPVTPAELPPPSAAAAPLSAEEVEERPLTGLRKAIAEHMVRSKRTSPHVTTVAEVDMTTLVEFRERRKASFQQQEGVPLTYLPFILRAVCAALKAFPSLNASLEGDKLLLRRYYHLGIAVATEAGLIVPVIRHADRLTLHELARALQRVAEGARARRLQPTELEGATFTITNPGALGGVLSTPIIHQPQAAILGVQAIRKLPVVRDDRIEIGWMMYLCLSYDHRIVDGATSVQFLQAVRRDLENPLQMFV